MCISLYKAYLYLRNIIIACTYCMRSRPLFQTPATILHNESTMTQRATHTMQDYNSESVATFDKNAANYADKYFSLRDYDPYYQRLVETMPEGTCRFLDLACGPGNVSAYVRAQRPKAEILCIDRAPMMLAEVTRRIAGAEALVADCRNLIGVTSRFHAAAFFFGLSYFDEADANRVLKETYRLMLPGATLLLATVAGDPANTGVQTNAAGDRVFSFFRRQADIEKMIADAGFDVTYSAVMPSPANASFQSEDVVVMAKRK